VAGAEIEDVSSNCVRVPGMGTLNEQLLLKKPMKI
jgi:hypothetical protein